jgi:hypothetical protein
MLDFPGVGGLAATVALGLLGHKNHGRTHSSLAGDASNCLVQQRITNAREWCTSETLIGNRRGLDSQSQVVLVGRFELDRNELVSR